MCGVMEWSIIYMKIFLIYLLLMNIAGFAAMELTSVRPGTKPLHNYQGGQNNVGI